MMTLADSHKLTTRRLPISSHSMDPLSADALPSSSRELLPFAALVFGSHVKLDCASATLLCGLHVIPICSIPPVADIVQTDGAGMLSVFSRKLWHHVIRN